MPLPSPYHPGFGARPAVMVGRDDVLARSLATLTGVANAGAPASSTMVLLGARGMGKTVTLDVVSEAAAGRGFVTADLALDMESDNVQLLASQVARALAPLEGEKRGSFVMIWARMRDRLNALDIEINAGVVRVATRGRGAAPVAAVTRREALVALLRDGAELARDHDRAGLAIFVDELQEGGHSHLVVIANALQDALKGTRPRVPLAVFAAGLPSTPERVMSAASFTERFDFRLLDRLDDQASSRALLEPALQQQVTWSTAASQAALAAAGGSPYLIQLIGHEAWTAAAPVPGATIGTTETAAALVEVRRGLGAGMFQGRWAKATPAEQRLMLAIARTADGSGTARTEDVTSITGRTSSQLSVARKGLIDKGLVDSPAHGRLRFTMPGFAEFVLDLDDPESV